MPDDNIIFFSASSKSDRFQLHWVCKHSNNYVTLEAFLYSLRDLDTRRLAYRANFLFFCLFRIVHDKYTGVSLTFEIVRNLTRHGLRRPMDEIDVLKQNTFSKFWVAVCYWLLRKELFSRISMVIAQIIRYCIHHTKTSGYSIAHWCCYSTADWTTEESRVDTRQG
jgi:uncharacterized membrane protein YjdF